MSGLVKYEAARHALAEAVKVDEVKLIHNHAQAIAAAARIANDKQLEIDASEIRIRAERRLGEMIRDQKQGEGLNEGGRPIKTGTAPEPVIDDRPTLAQVGISKKLSARSQAIAAIPANEFEETLDEHREKQQAVTAATMEKLTKKGQQAAEGQTEKKGPMIPGAMAAAIHRLRTEIEICSAKGWARCDREEVRKEVRKIERMIQ